MEEIKLEKQDWEEAKRISTQQIKEALKVQEINRVLLELAEKKLKEFPKDNKKLF